MQFKRIRPYVTAILGYAKRLSGLMKREKELDAREAQLAKEAAALQRIAQRAAQFETITTKPEDARPARDDLNTLSNLVARQETTSPEFADPPGSRNPRAEGKGRERSR